MTIRTARWPAGVPCWADLTVPDVSAAETFYADVVGWSFEDTGTEFGGYTIAQTRGAAAAGIGPLQPGSTTAWTLYLASDDVEQTEAAIKENGGSILLGTGDVGTLGRMCIGADPTGAAFGVWEAGTHIGASVVNEPGGLSWEDLRSTEPEAARAFYAAVFGYKIEPLPEAGADYATFGLPQEDFPLGGMGGMSGAPDGVPSHWVVYFGVDDADAAVSAAERGGGSVLAPAFDSPYGRLAALTDPFGASFWVGQFDATDQPDRSG